MRKNAPQPLGTIAGAEGDEWTDGPLESGDDGDCELNEVSEPPNDEPRPEEPLEPLEEEEEEEEADEGRRDEQLAAAGGGIPDDALMAAWS